ncbi:hypothetical protein VSS74_15085 [Conexibacter stalactiti]|uniref:Secreted protein n=1 Tax=Conexibacter stalactiti TaxID=1940611 RepID=A0ABU4HQS2_9ACTN|nr:hypothetical protein [Conexibacter stalactiti]MDW5595673.1 hypothetical protein [Conexibacter stalactiti]MEC5036315.1 hypothetical protein [Conexibacter stalactiti]
MRRPILAAAAAALAAAVGLAFCAAPASAGVWLLGMRVHNSTQYELTYKTTHAKNVDRWIQAPDIPASAATIPPLTTSVPIKYQQNTPFGDTWARVVWEVRRAGGGPVVGELSYEVKVICNVGCAFDYSRSTTATVSPSSLLGLSWRDNGKTPGAGYYGELTVSPRTAGVRGSGAVPPTLSVCSPRGAGAGISAIETVGVGCDAARRAIRAGTAGGARWSTPGWSCSRRTVSATVARVGCTRTGSSFAFRLRR